VPLFLFKVSRFIENNKGNTVENEIKEVESMKTYKYFGLEEP
jgi:hypothetical protein